MRKFLLLSALALGACYQPEKYESVAAPTDTAAGEGAAGTVHAINTGKQICNPAISGDTVNYPGAMLWLGFSGALVVKDAPVGYTTSGVAQHDRLTISNFDNSVAWFLLKDSVPAVRCEFQDPDWSAHPDWIATMGAGATGDDCENGEFIYSGWVVRPRDNARFRFNYEHLDYISTPHFWMESAAAGPADSLVQDSAGFDAQGLATVASVQQFFGTRQVKFSWSKEENGYTIHFVDYAEATPRDRALAKPEGRESWKAESGMISPDGKWIAYNLYERQDAYAVYVQELKAGSVPVLVADAAMDPRWWVNPADGRLFLVYMTVPTGASYINKLDLLDASLQESGAAGATWLQELKLYAGLPGTLAVERSGNPRLLVNLPFRAGLSPDGRYLATGTNDGFMMELR